MPKYVRIPGVSPLFSPSLNPLEILNLGAFGGTALREVHPDPAIVKKTYPRLNEQPIMLICSKEYSELKNQFEVKPKKDHYHTFFVWYFQLYMQPTALVDNPDPVVLDIAKKTVKYWATELLRLYTDYRALTQRDFTWRQEVLELAWDPRVDFIPFDNLNNFE